jgi:hypothetical protein
MGRRALKLTLAQEAEVETLAAVLTAEQVADYFGIGRTTFFNMIANDPEISERYKRGKAKAIGAIAQGLIQKARNGDTASMMFYLKCQAGWRERAEFIPALPEEPKAVQGSVLEALRAKLDLIAERTAQRDEIGGSPTPMAISHAPESKPEGETW